MRLKLLGKFHMILANLFGAVAFTLYYAFGWIKASCQVVKHGKWNRICRFADVGSAPDIVVVI